MSGRIILFIEYVFYARFPVGLAGTPNTQNSTFPKLVSSRKLPPHTPVAPAIIALFRIVSSRLFGFYL